MLSNAARATGYVVGQVAPLIQDLDGDHLADIRIPEGATVTFRPTMKYVVVDGVMVSIAPVEVRLDAQGYLYDPLRGGPGVWLPVGVWLVELPGRLGIPRPTITVTTEHTEATPYQLSSAIPALQLDQPRPALEVPVDGVEGQRLTWTADGLRWEDDGGSGTAPAQDVYPLTVTAPLVIAPGMAGTVTPWPSDRTIGLVVTQDATGGHVVTYDSIIDTTVGAGVRTDAGAVTAIYLTPLGGGLWRAVSDYITGTSPAPTLAAPTIATTPVSSTSFSVSYSTPETATAWQYSLDGAPDASLDGTSPDTISVTPGLSGVVAVRYQAGGVWSPYTTVAYSTVVTTTYRALTYGTGAATLTGDVTSGVGATATADTWLTTVHMLPRGVDGEVQVRMATAGATSGQVELYLRSDGLVQPSGGTASVAFGGKAICVSTTGGWVWGSPGAAQVSGGVAQAAGDVLRVRRVGLTVEGHVSKDDGDTWTSIGAATAASDPGVALIPCLRLAAGRQSTWLTTSGTTLWADTDAALATQRLTVSAGATGITESGDANAGWAYALSNAAGYAWCPLGDASSDATSSAIVVKLTSLTAGVAGCRVYMSNQASPSGTYPPPGDYDAMAINAAHAVSSWQSAAHIGLTTGPNNFGITAKVGDAIHAVSLAAGGSALWYDDQQRVRMVGSWPWATDSVIVDIPSSSGHASLSVSRASRA